MRVIHSLYSGVGGVYSVVDSLIKDKEKKIINGTLYFGPNISKDCLKHKSILKNNFFYTRTIKYLSLLLTFNVAYKLIKFKPDIIVLHNYQIFPVLILKLFYKSKVIYVDHTGIKYKGFRDNFILKFFNNFINKFIVLNNKNFDYLNNICLIPRSKITKIENGINLKFFKKKNHLKKKELIIGMASRIANTKHHSLLIDTVQSLIEKKINLKCLMAGDGELTSFLKKKVLKKNKKKIVFNGELDQKRLKKWFHKINLYVQATKTEAMSISIFNAMAMDIPVMGSNVNGINNLEYPNKKDKMLFENNSKDLEKKIINFMKMKKKNLDKLINNQKKYVLKNFSDESMIIKYKKIYNSLDK